MPRREPPKRLPILESDWTVPYDVTVEDENLVFTLVAGQLDGKRRVVPPDELELVNEFARLVDSLDPREKTPEVELDSEASILRFAKRYGPLWLVDGLPVTRIPLRLRNELVPETYRAAQLASWRSRAQHRESIAEWGVYSAQVQAIQHVVRLLAETPDDSLLTEDPIGGVLAAMWEYVGSLIPEETYVDSDDHVRHGRPQPSSVREWRLAIERAVQQWLDFGDVRVTFRWPSDAEPVVDWVADSLFGALAMQLSLAVAQCDRFAICAGCRHPFATSRRPRSDRDTYCSNEACKNFCQAQYQRRRRAREAAERDLSV